MLQEVLIVNISALTDKQIDELVMNNLDKFADVYNICRLKRFS